MQPHSRSSMEVGQPLARSLDPEERRSDVGPAEGPMVRPCLRTPAEPTRGVCRHAFLAREVVSFGEQARRVPPPSPPALRAASSVSPLAVPTGGAGRPRASDRTCIYMLGQCRPGVSRSGVSRLGFNRRAGPLGNSCFCVVLPPSPDLPARGGKRTSTAEVIGRTRLAPLPLCDPAPAS